MSMLLPMVPVYLLGNLHCAGMCGPLVAFLGRHRFKNAYFLGRILGFSLVAMIAGEVGFILNEFTSFTHISAFLTLVIALVFFIIAFGMIFNIKIKKEASLFKWLNNLSLHFSKLMLKDAFFPIFCFGFLTILLPCGQSLIIFSFSALTEDPLIGGLNGLLFSIATTPSLFASMRATYFFNKAKKHYKIYMGFSLLLVSMLSLLRGLADLGLVNHLVLLQNPHIVLY